MAMTDFASQTLPLCNSADLAEGGRAVPFDVVYAGQTCRAFAIRFEGWRNHAGQGRENGQSTYQMDLARHWRAPHTGQDLVFQIEANGLREAKGIIEVDDDGFELGSLQAAHVLR